MVTNAGGINTASCVAALEQACKASGVQLKIASVNGDNMIHLREKLLQSDAIRAMGGQERLPKYIDLPSPIFLEYQY